MFGVFFANGKETPGFYFRGLECLFFVGRAALGRPAVGVGRGVVAALGVGGVDVLVPADHVRPVALRGGRSRSRGAAGADLALQLLEELFAQLFFELRAEGGEGLGIEPELARHLLVGGGLEEWGQAPPHEYDRA